MEDIIFTMIETNSVDFLDLPTEEYKSKINMLSKNGLTFPYLHCIEKSSVLLSPLLKRYEKYIDINNTNKNGYTVLMEYAKQNDDFYVFQLLKKGADWKMKDNKGMTAMDYADLETLGELGSMEAYYTLKEWDEKH